MQTDKQHKHSDNNNSKYSKTENMLAYTQPSNLSNRTAFQSVEEVVTIFTNSLISQQTPMLSLGLC